MLETEMRNPATTHIDQADTIGMLEMLNAENFKAVEAVQQALPAIAAAVERAAQALRDGGRIIYVGAGTSGRLGVLDAAECPPTFGVSRDTVIGLIAGGEQCMVAAGESAEDDETAGARDIDNVQTGSRDFVLGISAAGNAAYVAGALERANSLGAATASLTCNPVCRLCEIAGLSIVTRTGPEAITGSTRLKAGTAQKLVLNMISTGAMVKTGKVYENLMINVRPVNQKLRERCIRIICELTGADAPAAEEALDKANGDIKEAAKALRGGRAV